MAWRCLTHCDELREVELAARLLGTWKELSLKRCGVKSRGGGNTAVVETIRIEESRSYAS